ncbi:glycosyltransferase family 2 protein [Rhodobacteraceae bacterium KMM 6894]|nr:glycosyltransferase family 2 protein [Rhodobacteraceae bacterium KMM 6894]
MAPAVSVVLPTFNRAHCLPGAMTSVLDQSFKDLELLIVDDASTEDIKAVVTEINDPRIRYLRLERNSGAAAARNVGLAKALGNYIAFQDSDDIWLPGKLAKQLELLKAQPPEVGVVTGLKIIYGRDTARVHGPGRVDCAPDPNRPFTLQEDQLKRSLVENRISLQNALFRRDCMPDIAWFDPRAKANNDWEFVVRLSQHKLILEVVEPVVLAMLSPDSISAKPRKRATGFLRILQKNKHVYARYPNEYGWFLYSTGMALYRCGRKRAGRQLILKSMRLRPQNALRLARGGLRRLIR